MNGKLLLMRECSRTVQDVCVSPTALRLAALWCKHARRIVQLAGLPDHTGEGRDVPGINLRVNIPASQKGFPGRVHPEASEH